MPYKNFLGYDKGKNGKPVINEKEAEIVRLIYRLFLQGKTASGICKHLDGLGTPTPTGRKAWNQTTINSILRNEKYKGDALLQKKFTVDFLTKKQKVNEGEIPQYYVEDDHPAIIDPFEFDMVQAEIARQQKLGCSYSGASIFSSKVICGECGSFYGQKIRHSNDPYRKVVWRCNRKFNGKYVCETPTLDADEIKEKFIIAYNQLLDNRKELFEACELMCEEVGDCSALNAEIDKLNEEIKEVTETVNRFVKENASTRLSQESYDQKYNSLVKMFEKANKRLSEVKQERDGQINRERELRIFISQLAEKPLVIEEWDEELWVSIPETAIVHKDGRITFMFKNGTSIEVGGG